MTTEDSKLRDALEDWRENRTARRYGKAHFRDLGPLLAMPNEVLDRIIICAHHRKISSIADLRTETRWDDIDHDGWGLEVVALIQTWCPPHPPLMTTTPMRQPSAMRPLSSNSNIGTNSELPLFTTPASRAKPKCSACGLVGHNGEFLDCNHTRIPC
jgi:hypothetical protein